MGVGNGWNYGEKKFLNFRYSIYKNRRFDVFYLLLGVGLIFML